MPTDSEQGHGREGAIQSTLLSHSAYDSAAMRGTVDATVEPVDRHAYGSISETVIRGKPVPALGESQTLRGAPARLLAKDLVAELDSINTQIHRITFQVERAVARLTTSG